MVQQVLANDGCEVTFEYVNRDVTREYRLQISNTDYQPAQVHYFSKDNAQLLLNLLKDKLKT